MNVNVAKSILALSLYLARKADMELAEVTEEDNKKRRQKTQSPKKKLSEAKKGKKISEESKKKISESLKGNTRTKGKHWKLVDGKRVYY